MKILADYRLYFKQIERLHQKYLLKGKVYGTSQAGLSFSRISILRKSFAKTLAKQVSRGKYEFKAVQRRRIRKSIHSNKLRTIFLLEISDLVVNGALGELVSKWSDSLLPDCVYSYRSGKGWWNAVKDFTDYLSAYLKSEPEIKKRGLYVFRGDVKEYTETIPVSENLPIWKQLEDLINSNTTTSEEAHGLLHFIKSALRPAVIAKGTFLHSALYGIPTGSPISTAVANLYLNELDRKLATIPGAFYARYGDDFIFAHPDPQTSKQAEQQMFAIVERLHLRINPEKFERFYFNGAGKAAAENPQYQGANQITFVGCAIDFKGTFSMSSESKRMLLRLIRRRVRRMLPHVKELPLEERGPLLCALVNRILDPGSVASHSFAKFLTISATNRNDLKDTDHAIALVIAESLSGLKGPRAFRHTPYKVVRSKYGLKSLVHSRNRSGESYEH